MFDHMVEANSLLYEFAKYGFKEEDLEFIKEQIAGPQDCTKKKVGFVAFNDFSSCNCVARWREYDIMTMMNWWHIWGFKYRYVLAVYLRHNLHIPHVHPVSYKAYFIAVYCIHPVLCDRVGLTVGGRKKKVSCTRYVSTFRNFFYAKYFCNLFVLTVNLFSLWK